MDDRVCGDDDDRTPRSLGGRTGRPHQRARRNRRHREPGSSSTTGSVRPTSADASQVPCRMTRSAPVPAFISRPFLGRRVASIRPSTLKVYCTLVLVEGARMAQARRPDLLRRRFESPDVGLDGLQFGAKVRASEHNANRATGPNQQPAQPDLPSCWFRRSWFDSPSLTAN